ncbi:MAG: AbrB/MazE/SpoVT family DNA-binding domain-containing protein [Armatimonadota bacterium]
MTDRVSVEDCYVGTVTVGERGQVVIPAEARKKMDIQTGDRLIIMSQPHGKGIVLLKLDAVREFLNRLAEGLNIAESAVRDLEQLNGGC